MKHKITLSLSKKMIEQLKQFSHNSHRSMSATVEWGLEELLRQEGSHEKEKAG